MQRNVSSYIELPRNKNEEFVSELDGVMNAETKQNIRGKVSTYLNRAEEIRNITKNVSPAKKAETSAATSRGSSKGKQGSDDDNGDENKTRMTQKFEGKLCHRYVAITNLILIYFRL